MASDNDVSVELWELLRRVVHEGRGDQARAYEQLELTATQAELLLLLDQSRPMAMSQLAGALHCEPPNVTWLVDKLTARGLVDRHGDPADRRRKMVALSQEGLDLVHTLQKRIGRAPALFDALPVRDKKALRDLLQKALQKTEG